MRRMYSKNQIEEMSRASTEALIEDGALDETINDAVLAYIDENPVDPTAITGLDIAPKDVTASGNITALSIIENMSGYSFTKPSDTANVSREFKYAGVVKNGNKVTFVIFAQVNILNDVESGTGITMGSFTIPLSIGNAIYPYTIGTLENVIAGGKITLISNIYAGADVYAYYRKTSATNINGLFYSGTSLTAGSSYLFRLEATFLLSENLVNP